jgi:hypothetical protein
MGSKPPPFAAFANKIIVKSDDGLADKVNFRCIYSNVRCEICAMQKRSFFYQVTREAQSQAR